MKSMQPAQEKRVSGFSLIELMVTSAMAATILMLVTQTLMVQNKHYIVIDQISEAQQNLRATTSLIERDVRRGGFMVPDNAAICGWDQTGGPDTLFISNTDVLMSIYDLEGNNENLRVDFGVPLNDISSTTSFSGTATLAISRTWADVQDADGDTEADVDFEINGGVIVVNRNEPDGLAACGIIQTLSSTQIVADFGSSTFGPAGFNSDVVAVPALVYQLTVGSPNVLSRSGMLVASDVEDLQISHFFDLDDDRVIDANEEFGTDGGIDQPWELTPSTNRPDYSTLREVRVSVVTVTRSDDPNINYDIGIGQLTGNRATGLPLRDGKRRRVSTARIRLRNAGA
jgi:type II secretory pathway pseudopilin PulG